MIIDNQPASYHPWGTDNGPECTSCRGTVYSYTHDNAGVISGHCVSCHGKIYFRVVDRTHGDIRDLSAAHRAAGAAS